MWSWCDGATSFVTVIMGVSASAQLMRVSEALFQNASALGLTSVGKVPESGTYVYTVYAVETESQPRSRSDGERRRHVAEAPYIIRVFPLRDANFPIGKYLDDVKRTLTVVS